MRPCDVCLLDFREPRPFNSWRNMAGCVEEYESDAQPSQYPMTEDVVTVCSDCANIEGAEYWRLRFRWEGLIDSYVRKKVVSRLCVLIYPYYCVYVAKVIFDSIDEPPPPEPFQWEDSDFACQPSLPLSFQWDALDDFLSQFCTSL